MNVADLEQVLSLATMAAFLLIAAHSLRDWMRTRDAGRGWLALAILALGLVTAAGQVTRLVPHSLGWAISDLTLVLFMLSGLSLLLFRSTVIPLNRRILAGAVVVTALVTAAAIGLVPGTSSSGRSSPASYSIVLALIAVWAISVGEPSVRFWLVSRRLPAVQRGRLRALSAGYAAIVVVLVIDVAGGAVASGPAFRVASAILVLGIVPLLYAGFAPPRWLRRAWRDSEESQLWQAIHDIIMYSPDRPTMGHRALEWALRLAGANRGFLAFPAGTILARQGISEEEARSLDAVLADQQRGSVVRTAATGPVILAPVRAGDVQGTMVLLAGPFTPVFGDDEVARIAQYAGLLAAGLERVALVEAVREQTAQAEAAQRKLETVNKELEAFTYTVSHDLRAPLRAINGFTAILLEEHTAELSADARNYLARVGEGGKHMGVLVDDLLAFSRVSRQAFRKSSVRSGDVVRTVWARLSSDLGERSVEFRIGDLPLVESDPILLEQVFHNLLSNALKYSAKREKTIIEVGAEPDQNSGETTFYVKDNGVGFDMRYAGKLFGVFQRLHSADEYDGTGVGLAIVQRIVQRHGGRIWAEAEPERGATFYFTLGGTREWQAAA